MLQNHPPTVEDSNSPLIVKELNSLHLDIHTIGYPNEGESLLTLLCDDNEVLFSVLTDCYENKGYNHASKLLDELKVKQIDAFIWTHPDEDHSVGIPEFLAKYDPHKKAEIFVPCTLNSKMGLGQKAKKALEYVLKHYNSRTIYDLYYVMVHKPSRQHKREVPRPVDTPISMKIEVINPRVKNITYSYNFILPNDDVIHRPLESDSDTLFNNLSIVYYISFNGFSFFFCGDLSEQNVQFIPSNLLKDAVFIKIPHHGSSNLKSLVPLFDSQNVKNAISTTTVYKRHNLPRDEVLNEYKTISDGVYCTSNIHDNQNKPYGCITAKFSANMEKPDIKITGNAYCYYRKNDISDT